MWLLRIGDHLRHQRLMSSYNIMGRFRSKFSEDESCGFCPPPLNIPRRADVPPPLMATFTNAPTNPPTLGPFLGLTFSISFNIWPRTWAYLHPKHQSRTAQFHLYTYMLTWQAWFQGIYGASKLLCCWTPEEIWMTSIDWYQITAKYQLLQKKTQPGCGNEVRLYAVET